MKKFIFSLNYPQFRTESKVRHIQPVFRFRTQIFLKSNNSGFKKGNMEFLKRRVYCI